MKDVELSRLHTLTYSMLASCDRPLCHAAFQNKDLGMLPTPPLWGKIKRVHEDHSPCRALESVYQATAGGGRQGP